MKGSVIIIGFFNFSDSSFYETSWFFYCYIDFVVHYVDNITYNIDYAVLVNHYP